MGEAPHTARRSTRLCRAAVWDSGCKKIPRFTRPPVSTIAVDIHDSRRKHTFIAQTRRTPQAWIRQSRRAAALASTHRPARSTRQRNTTLRKHTLIAQTCRTTQTWTRQRHPTPSCEKTSLRTRAARRKHTHTTLPADGRDHDDRGGSSHACSCMTKERRRGCGAWGATAKRNATRPGALGEARTHANTPARNTHARACVEKRPHPRTHARDAHTHTRTPGTRTHGTRTHACAWKHARTHARTHAPGRRSTPQSQSSPASSARRLARG